MHLAAESVPGLRTRNPTTRSGSRSTGLPTQRRWTVFFRIFLALPALAARSGDRGQRQPRAPARSGAYGTASTAAAPASSPRFSAGSPRSPGRDAARPARPHRLRDRLLGADAARTSSCSPIATRRPTPARRPDGAPRAPGGARVRATIWRGRGCSSSSGILLALPHLVWLTLWTVLRRARRDRGLARRAVPGPAARAPLHRFLAAYVRYTTHVSAFLY